MSTNGAYKIEDGIPLSPHGNTGRRQPAWMKYPFSDLDVGQSFLVPKGMRQTVAAAASTAGHRLRRRFATRLVDGGVRIWRIA